MNERDMLARTRAFAIRVVRLCESLPAGVGSRTISSQLCRSGTSVGANYRAACRGRSRAEFLAKLGTVEEEADESQYWMELLVEAKLVKPPLVLALMKEASELTAIVAASRKTLKRQS